MKSKLFKLLMLVLPLVAFSFTTIQDNTLIYKLTLEKMFKPEEAVKTESVFRENNAPFSIVKINYEEKVIVVRCPYTIDYDVIKQHFDKLKLRITKETVYKTFEDYQLKNGSTTK